MNDKPFNGKISGRVLSFQDYLTEAQKTTCICASPDCEKCNPLEENTSAEKARVNLNGWLLFGDEGELKMIYSHFVRNYKNSDNSLLGKTDKEMRKIMVDAVKDFSDEKVKKFKSEIDEATKGEDTDESQIMEGFGERSFYLAKNGDTYNYLFKIEGDKDERGFVLSVGKLCKFAKPTEDKNQFSAMSLIELRPEEIDQAVIDKGKYKTNESVINMSDSETTKVLSNIGECITDYLQKNPRVEKFYDEIQGLVKNQSYDSKVRVSLDKWPGSLEVWSLQEVDAGKLNIITK